MFLVCKRGDLLKVERDEENPTENWIRAVNQRTGDSGAVYQDTVQFLPTLSRPTEEILVVTMTCLLSFIETCL